MGEISGINLKIIAEALNEFRKHDLEISNYNIVVAEEDNEIIVSFIDNDFWPEEKAPLRKRGFEVHLSKNDLRLLRWNFSR